MLRTLPIFVALLLWASVAAGQVCTLGVGDGTETLGPIVTYSDDCDEGGAPAATDQVIVPDGLTLTIEDATTWTGSGGLICKSGGKIIIDNATAAGRVILTFEEGMDGITTLQGSLDNVAIYQEAGCEFDFDAAYVEWGKAIPALVATHTATNDTTWQAAWLWECYGGSGARATPFGVGTCGASTNDYVTSFYWDSGIHNPNDACGADCGDTYLSESLIVADPGMLVCGERTTAWSGHCYPIQAVDSGIAGDFDISVNVVQNSSASDGLVRSEDTVDYPMADRQLEPMALYADVSPGDVCIAVDDGLIPADGDYAGRWVRLPGDDGGRTYKIALTDSAADCTGTAGGDAIWLDAPGSTLNAVQIKAPIADTGSIIVGYEFEHGDNFYVMSQVSIEATENAVDGDAIVVLEGTNNWEGVQLIGMGLTHFDGAVLTGLRNHWLNGGADGASIVKFEDMTTVRLVDSSIVGGGLTGGANGIELAGITGGVIFDNVAIRYVGGWAVITSAGTASMGSGNFKRTKCEFIGDDAATVAATAGCISNGHFSRLSVDKLVLSNTTHGANGLAILAAAAQPTSLVNVGVWGETEGGIQFGVSGLGITASNMLGRGAQTNRSMAAQEWLPKFMDGLDLGLYRCASCSGPINEGAGGSLTNFVLRSATTANDQLLVTLTSGIVKNGYVHNAQTTDTSDTAVLKINHDNLAASDATVENLTFAWDLETQSEWIRVINDSGTTTNEDALYFGGITISGFYGADQDVDYTAIDLDTGIIDEIDSRAGGICVSEARVATGGTGSITSIDDFTSYATAPYLALTPRFISRSGGNFAQVDATLSRVLGCDVRGGTQKPAFNIAGNDWLMRQLGIDRGRRTALLERPRSWRQ